MDADAALSTALERIEAARTGSGRSIDLSGLGLRWLPEELFDALGGESSMLEDISLASNALTELPDRFDELPGLKRLALAGNALAELPGSLCRCARLEGLWVHGNALRALPEDIGQLRALSQLSCAGNELSTLPDSLGELRALRSLSVAGNRLRALPATLGNLSSLETLEAHGNALEALPESASKLYALRSLMLQGNALGGHGCLDALGGMRALEVLNVASNARLEALPCGAALLPRLMEVTAYGTALSRLPEGMLVQDGGAADARRLRAVWLEGSPLDPSWTASVASASVQSRVGAVMLGLDEDQWEAAAAVLQREAGMSGVAPAARGSHVRVCAILGHDAATRRAAAAAGYFKLERGAGAADSDAEPPSRRALVVALGSAPGTPNWAGALSRARVAMEIGASVSWDVCYAVDARRDWYRAEEFATFLAEATDAYARVVLLGDSMGGSGALLLAPAATRVLAFTPQVDLLSSALRPGGGDRSGDAERAYAERMLGALRVAGERGTLVDVHTGNWQNDLAQADAAGSAGDHVDVVVHPYNSHRVAKVREREQARARVQARVSV